MQVRIRWRRRALPGDEHPRAALDGLFRRLGQVPYYASPERREELEAASLGALAPVEMQEFLDRPAQFRHPASRPAERPFECPLQPAPKTAVLRRGFRSAGPVRAFAGGWSDAVRAFQPESIAAPAAELSQLARAVRSGRLALPWLRHAAVALVSLGEEWPDETERESWWDAFGVPVFEYLLGPGGELLAMECEARAGLHVPARRAVVEVARGEVLVTPLEASVARLRTGWAGRVEDGLCGCGRRGIRLVGLSPVAAGAFVAARAG